MKRIFRKTGRNVVLTGALAAIMSTGAAAGGALRVGWDQEPQTLNPMAAVSVQAVTLMRSMIYETLVAFDNQLNIVPMLAKSWEVSEDGRVWTFTLDDGPSWQDGVPLTSADVAFTIRYVRDNDIKTLVNFVNSIQQVETPDAKTVRLTYGEPIATVLSDLAGLFIVAEHKWSQIPGEEAGTYENREPLGSGPFALNEWQRGSFMRFEANMDYWRYTPGLDEVIYTYFAAKDPMIQSLKSGAIQAVAAELPPLAAMTLSRDDRIEVSQSNSLYYRHIVLNSSNFGKGNPALRDARVRRALSMTVDRKKIGDLIHRGAVQSGLSIVPAATPFYYNSDLTPFAVDTDAANALLDEAGWVDSNDNGIRDKDGVELELTLNVIARWPEEMRSAEMIRESWKAIGVGLNIQAADAGSILADLFPDYAFDMYLWGFSGAPDPNFLLSTNTTDQIQAWNGAGYSNPDYDRLYEQQYQTADPAERQKLVHELQDIHYQEAPTIVLYYMDNFSAYRSDLVEGFDTDMPGGIVAELNVDNFNGVQMK